MAVTISIDQLSDAVQKELTLYNKEIVNGIKKEAKSSMNDLVKKTKETAPVGRRHKHYKDSITSKKQSEDDRGATYVWYVKGSDYRLSHLLENGHATRSGGRSKAYHFIKNASDPILNQYLHNIEEIIKNG